MLRLLRDGLLRACVAIPLLAGCASPVFMAGPVLAGEACPNPDALGTSRTIEINPAQKLRLGLKTYDHTLELKPHEVVLTFDDGPLPATTGPVLKALADECVKATFFLVGRNAQANPAAGQRQRGGCESQPCSASVWR